MSKYTFGEIQEVIKELRCISLQGTCDIEAEMLTEYAERIKADEGEGEICFTTDAKGNILAVTRNDSDGHILSVLVESPAQPTKLEDGMVIVPREPTVAMLDAALNLHGYDAFLARAPTLLSALVKIYKAMITAALQENAK